MTTLPDPLIGRVIQETWRIDAFVARGSMGAVYRGTNVKIGTAVAIKVLNPEFLHDDEIRERFRREATISSRCNSVHLVRVLDLSTEADGYVALIMEWLAGRSLAAFLREHGPLDVPQVVTLLTQIGEGLTEAHDAGIVHRDLKPGNIFLAESGQHGLTVPKILDFGISKILEEGGDLTGTATMMGTPHYMPVEQFDSSRDVDHRADIYALGVITYELLAGRRPFAGGSPVQILNQVTSSDPPPLPAEVPEGVARVVLKAMARQRQDRYQSVTDYVEALTAAAHEAGLGPEATPTEIGLFAVEGDLRPERPPRPLWLRHRRAFALGAAALVSLVIPLTVVLLWGSIAGDHRIVRPSTRRAPRDEPWRPVRTLLPPDAGARGLAVDAEGRLLVSVSQRGVVRLWLLADGRELGRLGDRARCVAVSPDGRLAAVGDATGKLHVWQLEPLGRLRSVDAHRGAVRAVAFSGDGNRLLSAGVTGAPVLWDVVGGRALGTLVSGGSALAGSATAVGLSGDGHRAAVGLADGGVLIWELPGVRLVQQLAAHPGGVTAVALQPSGQRLVTAGRDGAARLWALPAGTRTKALEGHRGAVSSAGLSEDGRWVFTGGADRTARLWALPAGRLLRVARLPGPVSAVALARAGRLQLLAGPTLGIQVYRAPPAAPPMR